MPRLLRAARRTMAVLLTPTLMLACSSGADGSSDADRTSGKRPARALRAPAIGAPVPAFAAMQLDGSPVTLESLAGQVVVLNVWATWCLPCLEEIPQLESIHQQYAARGLRTVGVSVDAAGMGGDVAEFVREHGMSYTVWLDPDHQFSLKFLTNGVPETFVFDRSGHIRYRMIGAVRPGDTTLVTAVRRALDS